MCEFAEETALQLTRREGRIPLCSAVDASKSNIFIITNSTFDFYKITDEVEIYESIPWILIKSVKVKLKTLEIAFRDKKIVIDSSKNDEIFKTIGHILKQMMTEDELSKIGYQRKSLNRVKNSFYGVLLRFQQQASIKGMK